MFPVMAMVARRAICRVYDGLAIALQAMGHASHDTRVGHLHKRSHDHGITPLRYLRSKEAL